MSTLESRFKFDEVNQIVEIDGVKVSAELLTVYLTKPSPPRLWFRTVRGVDGTIVVHQKDEDA
jgi:hypothetical protein